MLSHMNRLRILTASLVLLLALTGFVFWRVHWSGPEGTDASLPKPAPSADQTPTPAVEPVRELEVTGVVVGSDLAPVPGVEVVFGSERASVNDKGAFSFPRARRARLTPLQVLRGAQELAAWGAVISGDQRPEPPTEPEGGSTEGALVEDDLSRALAPPFPGRIRLTINLAPAQSAVDPAAPPWLHTEEALVEDWGEGARIWLRGSSRLPDGAQIAACLYFDGERTVAAPEPVVKGSRFEAVMYWPREIGFFSGEFEVQVSFSAGHQASSAREAWAVEHPGVDWEQLEATGNKRSIFAGSHEESRAEDAAAGAYYAAQITEARRLERALKSTLSSTADQRRVWLTGARPRKRDAKDGTPWFQKEYLLPDGKLDEARWRKFLDEEWRPEVRRLTEEHVKRGSEKYGRASTMLSALLAALLDASYGYSKFVVYPAFGLGPHPNDDYVDEERSADLVRLEKVIASSFEGLERYRDLGK